LVVSSQTDPWLIPPLLQSKKIDLFYYTKAHFIPPRIALTSIQ
jgi:hypothetical protein